MFIETENEDSPISNQNNMVNMKVDMNNSEIENEIKRCIDIEAAAIGKLKNGLDMDTAVNIVRLIGDCKGRIVLTGCGTSAMAARKIAHTLNCIERPALFLTPSDAVHGALGVLREGDLLILISKGGNTSELLPLLSAGKTKRVRTVAVTENPDSVLGKESDICLKIKVDAEPCRFNMLATASTLAVISAFDAICIALMQYTNYTREQFAVIHPGGAVGDRLLGKVK